MGLGESIADFLGRFFKKRSVEPRVPRLDELERFVETHRGVEGYIEPRTATNPTTLLLVDRDGDNVRAPVGDAAAAAAFCDQHGLPVYDAAVIGYPSRMRQFESRRKSGDESSYIDEQFADIERRLREESPDTPDN